MPSMGFGMCDNFRVCTFYSPWWTKGELFDHHTFWEGLEVLQVFPLAVTSFFDVKPHERTQ